MTNKNKCGTAKFGPPAVMANQYVYERLQNDCTECPCCGEPWRYKAARESGVNIMLNIGGRLMAVRRAMYMAAFPGKMIVARRRITSRCKDSRCINPRLLYQATAGELLKTHYEKGIRCKRKAAAHLVAIKQGESKLSQSDVMAILNDNRKGAEAAHEWGITKEHYNAIQRGAARQMRNPFAGLGARA
jgi:hypothetical protein